MEASATTVNIQSQGFAEVPKPQKRHGAHSHGPNFGKYVEGCSECIRKCPDGPPANGYIGKAKRIRHSTADVAQQAKQALQQEANQLVERLNAERARADELASQIKKSEDPMSKLVELMLSREAKTIQKEMDVEARAKAAREDMLRITREALAQKTAHQNACSHTKENGRSAVNGQVHNDGLYHPLCLRCMKEFPPQAVGKEAISNGVQVL